jgi:tRNA pseudouridine38-40 synthase
MSSMKNLKNLKVIIAFNGANYHGFQKQNNAVTVQEVLECALTKLLKHEVAVIGCSRTDAGVHAREFCFNMRTGTAIPDSGLVRGLNALLPKDIAVHSCETVPDSFHARYDSKSKEYVYLIHSGAVRDVFTQGAYFYPQPLNIPLMREAAKLFTGEHDFSAYCKAESLEITRAKKHGAVREIHELRVEESACFSAGQYTDIIVRGNGFLHNMVRIIAGTLLYVGEGKLTLEEIEESLKIGANRTMAGKTLPACGLYLRKVVY